MSLHVFKPITTARRQVMMKEIACTIVRVERRVSKNIVDRAGVRLIKTIETWKEGEGLGMYDDRSVSVKTNTLVPTLLRLPCFSWYSNVNESGIRIVLDRLVPWNALFLGLRGRLDMASLMFVEFTKKTLTFLPDLFHSIWSIFC